MIVAPVNPSPYPTPDDELKSLADIQFSERVIRWYRENIYQLKAQRFKLWWKWVPGEVVAVPWPDTEESSDPNETYRPFLEANVGRQGWDWQWDIDTTGWDLLIKLRKGKTKWGPILALMWAGK